MTVMDNTVLLEVLCRAQRLIRPCPQFFDTREAHVAGHADTHGQRPSVNGRTLHSLPNPLAERCNLGKRQVAHRRDDFVTATPTAYHAATKATCLLMGARRTTQLVLALLLVQ